ncbi:hypothetical protein HU200_056983 [Digitaria exilis]|uniref:Uncharacterized protein n=1 Tax=Digitaria exilis TaxID=1010633 RepID=A0A835AG84_9POAL|nr:hypothetical protein HU200_056983 [Digitaria exilis]CAB3476809.1 unnamed protein product [Digitaria exilis]
MDRYRIAPARPVCLSSAAAAGPGAHLRPGRRHGGAEIGIFTAERYFSAADVISRDAAVIVPAAPTLADDHELSVPAADVASQSGRRTAASSEASWNSRSGLLSARAHPAAPPKAAVPVVYDHQGYYHRGRKTTGGSGQRWTLCPCAGKKAVTIVDVASSEPPRSPMAAAQHLSAARFSPQSAVDECLESDIFKKANQNHPSSPPMAATPPADQSHQELPAKEVKITVTPGTGSRAFPLATSNVAFAAAPNRSVEIDRRVMTSAGFTFPAALGALDELPRLSLEVFRPIDEDTVMLANPPRAMAFARGAPPVAAVVEEEAMSDASSDLFDLESFAASSSYPTTYRGRGSRRNSADDDLPFVSGAGVEPAVSECMYPASEASVVWSVVTAEGGAFDAASVANFSSAASACCVDDDLRYYMVPESPEVAGGFTDAMSRTAGRKKIGGGGGGGGGFLNSCRCEKAVSVGPTPVRVVRPPAHPAGTASRKKKGGGDGAAPARYHPGRAAVAVRT